MNASIEAARAGLHGKGFSLVAEEVRKLAIQTGNATDQVAQLVSEIQTETKALLTQTEQGKNSVDQGSTLSVQTNESFKQISKMTNKNTKQLDHLLDNIDSIREQVNQLLNEVQEITKVSQHYALSTNKISESGKEQTLMMQDINAASKELATIAEQLQLSIEQFEH